MGVDGIGGGRPIRGIGPAETAAVTHTPEAGQAAGAASAPGVSGTTPLERLERGEIDLQRYLDTRVDDAVRHLDGRLPGAELEFVKQALREELASDPVLLELVRRATGLLPTPR
jgi:hypothetical protein